MKFWFQRATSNNVLLLGAGRGATAVLALLAVRLYTGLLSHAEVGRLSIIVALSTTIAVITDRSFGAYWYRMMLDWDALGTARAHFVRTIARTCAATIIIAAVVFAFPPLVEGVVQGRMSTAALIVAGALITSVFSLVTQSLNIAGKPGGLVIGGVAGSAVGLMLAAGLTARRHFAESWLTGVYAGNLLLALILVIPLVQRLRPNVNGEPVPRHTEAWVRFVTPSVAVTLLYSMQLVGYRILVGRLAGTQPLGLFVVGFGLGVSALNAFEQIATQVLHPTFLSALVGADRRAMSAAWNEYAATLLPSLVAFIAAIAGVGPLLILIFANRTYASAGILVAFGAVTDGLRILGQLLVAGAHAALVVRKLVLPSLLGVVVAFGLIMLLTPASPLIGSGIALVAGGSAGAIYLWRNVSALLDIEFPFARCGLAFVMSAPVLIVGFAAQRYDSATHGLTLAAILAALGIYSVLVQIFLLRTPLAQRVRERAVVISPE